MQEFTTVSSSSYDPAALAAKLTEKSAEGWTVVGIVSTGGDVTAFLSRESTGVSTEAAAPASTSWDSGATTVVSGAVPVVEPAPAPAPDPVAEPAGWATAPEPAPAASYEPQPAASYEPQPAATYTPAATVAPAAAAPAVPAGWYADPAGRFELRYWDGSTWTEHVSRAGQQYTDPPVA